MIIKSFLKGINIAIFSSFVIASKVADKNNNFEKCKEILKDQGFKDDSSIKNCIINNKDEIVVLTLSGNTLSQNNIDSISTFTSLEELDILSTEGKNLDIESLQKLKKLSTLRINIDSIQDESIKVIKNLKKVEIKGNVTKNIIDQFALMTTIEEFNILHNSDDQLCLRNLEVLTKLSTLNVECTNSKGSGFEDTSFAGIKNLKKLTMKGFTYNQKDFTNISKLTTLEELTVSNYKYVESLNHSCLEELIHLNTLIFENSNSEVYGIPIAIFNLPELKRLIVRNVGLNVIFDEIKNAKKLEYLDIGNNKLTSFPPNLHTLKKLRYLDLSKNLIKDDIPKSLNKLSNLEYVDFSENKGIKGMTLTNPSLETCLYDNSSSLCKAKKNEMFR